MLASVFLPSSHPITIFFFFFFNDPAPTEFYPLPLHDALPISRPELHRDALGRRLGIEPDEPRRGRERDEPRAIVHVDPQTAFRFRERRDVPERPDVRGSGIDRKSTRLNSSHGYISYAVFCLKK